MTEFSGRVWRAGKPVDVELDMAAISDYLAEDDTLVWADVYDPDHTRWRRWPRSWD
jgi:magnesium transporter